MKQEINPKDTNRADAFELWMKSPMPMVTLTKTFDVTRLHKMSRQKGMKFNMLLCWCIGKAASQVAEFFDLPCDDKMYRFDRLAIGPVIVNCKGGINYCDIPFSDDLQTFCKDYQEIAQIIQTELDTIVNQYAMGFNNPMVMWGKYRKGWFKVTLPISFQFHHVQMDGAQAAIFLEELQKVMNELK